MVAQNNAALEDQQWYADSEANAHITADLENLNIQQPFNGQDTAAVGNGLRLPIHSQFQIFTFLCFTLPSSGCKFIVY